LLLYNDFLNSIMIIYIDGSRCYFLKVSPFHRVNYTNGSSSLSPSIHIYLIFLPDNFLGRSISNFKFKYPAFIYLRLIIGWKMRQQSKCRRGIIVKKGVRPLQYAMLIKLIFHLIWYSLIGAGKLGSMH